MFGQPGSIAFSKFSFAAINRVNIFAFDYAELVAAS
jgi:hypothetical protein